MNAALYFVSALGSDRLLKAVWTNIVATNIGPIMGSQGSLSSMNIVMMSQKHISAK